MSNVFILQHMHEYRLMLTCVNAVSQKILYVKKAKGGKKYLLKTGLRFRKLKA
jgi:hypothetical protein